MGLKMEMYAHWKGVMDCQKTYGAEDKHYGHCRYLNDCLWHKEESIGVQWKFVNMGKTSNDYHKGMELKKNSNVN